MSDGFDRKPGEHGSPEEEAQHDLECSIYQNYTASEVFVQGLAGVVNQQDVEAMIRAQKKMWVALGQLSIRDPIIPPRRFPKTIFLKFPSGKCNYC